MHRSTWWMVLALGLSRPALAGGGPWVVGAGNTQLYLGFEAQRFTRLAIQVGGSRQVVGVDEGVTSFGTKAIATVGLTPAFDIEVEVPWDYVFANRTDGPVCTALGLGACRPTRGVGVLAMRAKVLAADELAGAPVSMSLGADLHYGGFTAKDRQRITNLGEGTLDMGLFGTVGRSGSLGTGYWNAWAEAAWRHRVPINRDYPGPVGALPVPGDELHLQAEAMFAPQLEISVGPAVDLLWRYGGLNWDELALGDVDRLAALRIFTLRAGAKMSVWNGHDVSWTVGVLRTLWTVNNPSDVWVGFTGLSFSGLLHRKEP